MAYKLYNKFKVYYNLIPNHNGSLTAVFNVICK